MTQIKFDTVDPGRTFSPTVSGFYKDGANPVEVLRLNGRAIFGEGADTFPLKTRDNNLVDDTEAWVHLLDEGNNFFKSTNATTVTSNITSSATTIPIGSSSGLATSGHAKIEDEIVAYTGVTPTSLTGVIRGQLGTTAASHSLGAGLKKQAGPYGSRLQYAQTTALVSGVSDRGQGISGASRTIRGDAIGVAGFARMDDSGIGTGAWGGYLEGVRGYGTVGDNSVWGLEIGVMNFAGDQAVSERGGTPYYQGFGGQTLGMMVQTGGGNTNSANADNPYAIVRGGARFWRGFVVEADSIEGVDGEKPEAFLMPEDYTVSWYAPDTNRVFNLFSSIPSVTYAQEQIVNEFGLSHRLMDGNPLFVSSFVSNAKNYINVKAGATGVDPIVQSAGSTNSGIEIKAQGLGKIHLNGITRITLPGPFADDLAASSGGVGLNETYRATDGTVRWRQV